VLGVRQSGDPLAILGGAAFNTVLLSETQAAARELLRHPESETTKAVVRLAREKFADQTEEIGVN